jgi:hypothetical protein
MKRINFYQMSNSEIEKIRTEKNTELVDLMNKTCFEHMKIYFGNGKGVNDSPLKTLTANVDGVIITATEERKRYSYRWHKRVWHYAINGVSVTRHKLFRYL